MLIEIPKKLIQKIHLAKFKPLDDADLQLLQQCVSRPAQSKPLIVIGVEGGVVQGVSTTVDMEVVVVDRDNNPQERVVEHIPVVDEISCRALLQEELDAESAAGDDDEREADRG